MRWPGDLVLLLHKLLFLFDEELFLFHKRLKVRLLGLDWRKLHAGLVWTGRHDGRRRPSGQLVLLLMLLLMVVTAQAGEFVSAAAAAMNENDTG